MSDCLSCRLTNAEEILKLRDAGVLERYNWLKFEHNDIFAVFSENGVDIGVVEISVVDENTPYIAMIEVFSRLRSQSYGTKIVRYLQTEFDSISCSPIYTSDLFFRGLGFVPSSNNSQIWFWHRIQ